MMKNIAIITNMPSYHQVDLFNAISQLREINLHVYYLRKITPGRQWKTLRNINHSHTFVKEFRIHPHFYINKGLFKKLRAFRPDLIIVTQYASISMQLVMYYASLFKVPWVFWSEKPGVEWTELPIFKSEFLRKLFRKIALIPIKHWPQEVWGIGKRAQEYFSEITNCPCKNLPYFADFSRFLQIKRDNPHNPIRFLYAGKFVLRKGVDILIEAVDSLISKKKNFEFIFIGDGPLRNKVVELSHEYPSNVKYLGFKEIDEIPSVFAECDILVCPSRYDGWGMVVAEAMAAGMPVISTIKTGAAIDMINNGINGFILEKLTPEELALKMLFLIDRKNIVSEMGKSAKVKALEYTAHNGARIINDLLNGVLKKRISE